MPRPWNSWRKWTPSWWIRPGHSPKGNRNSLRLRRPGSGPKRRFCAFPRAWSREASTLSPNAIVSAATTRGLRLSGVREFRAVTGKGILGIVDGYSLAIGNNGLLHQLGIDGGLLSQLAENLRLKGQTVMFVLVDQVPAGLLCVADPIKASAEEARFRASQAGNPAGYADGETAEPRLKSWPGA